MDDIRRRTRELVALCEECTGRPAASLSAGEFLALYREAARKDEPGEEGFPEDHQAGQGPAASGAKLETGIKKEPRKRKQEGREILSKSAPVTPLPRTGPDPVPEESGTDADEGRQGRTLAMMRMIEG